MSMGRECIDKKRINHFLNVKLRAKMGGMHGRLHVCTQYLKPIMCCICKITSELLLIIILLCTREVIFPVDIAFFGICYYVYICLRGLYYLYYYCSYCSQGKLRPKGGK